mmetsp:Transcript_150797/g.274444  ORF Transcript_150797/g.274444 Transcript_150797/m.274444 type:complete len:80 (+) Transcript_150797:69-308(+)
MPNDTAGLSEPPEMPPIAKPPTVTHEPIAKPNMSFDFVGGVTAVQSTTKQSTKVKMISAVATCPQLLLFWGARAKVCPW